MYKRNDPLATPVKGLANQKPAKTTKPPQGPAVRYPADKAGMAYQAGKSSNVMNVNPMNQQYEPTDADAVRQHHRMALG